MNVRLATLADRTSVTKLRATLWPEGSHDEHAAEVAAILSGRAPGTLPLVMFVAEADGNCVGFIEVGLRSHADGCDPSRPVAFVEGWFVTPEFAGRGVGRTLMNAAEQWGRAQGCREMASDTWIDNEASQRAHEALGFEVVDRCVNYRKNLQPDQEEPR